MRVGFVRMTCDLCQREDMLDNRYHPELVPYGWTEVSIECGKSSEWRPAGRIATKHVCSGCFKRFWGVFK